MIINDLGARHNNKASGDILFSPLSFVKNAKMNESESVKAPPPKKQIPYSFLVEGR